MYDKGVEPTADGPKVRANPVFDLVNLSHEGIAVKKKKKTNFPWIDYLPMYKLTL